MEHWLFPTTKLRFHRDKFFVKRLKSLIQTMKKFLSTAPVVAALFFTMTAGILIEWNRFFPDLLFHPL